MSRLIAFGCSITYGHGLPDCYQANRIPGPTPSVSAWPSLLAKELGLECINLGECGSTNKGILMKILGAKYKPGDIVVILWTFHQRASLFEDNGTRLDIIPALTTDQLALDFYKVHGDFDLKMQSLFDIIHANSFLRSKNIEVHNFSVDAGFEKFLRVRRPFIDSVLIRFMSYGEHWPIDYAPDGKHPGTQSHKILAAYMLQYKNLQKEKHEN